MKKTLITIFFLFFAFMVKAQFLTVDPDSIIWKSVPLVTDEDNPTELIDEQAVWGGVIQTPVNSWEPRPRTSWHYLDRPYEMKPTVKIKFDAYYNLYSAKLYDRNGIGTIYFFTGEIDTAYYARYDQTFFNQWGTVAFSEQREVKSITIVIDTANINNNSPAAPTEIVFYGSYSRPKEPEPRFNRPIVYPYIGDFLGVNGFNDDPPGKLAVAPLIRFYHDWPWDQPDTLLFTYAPSSFAGQDMYQFWTTMSRSPFRYIANFKQALRSVTESPIVMQTADSLLEYAYAPDYKPIRWDRRDRSYDTAAYYEWQRYITKQMATWSSVGIDTFRSMHDPNQWNIAFGLNAIQNFEWRNEPDKTWRKDDGFANAQEDAVINYVEGKETKRIDPSANFIQGALADPNIFRIKATNEWFLERGKVWPVDKFNVHHYSNDVGGQGGNATAGEAPEWDAGLFNKHYKLVNYVNSAFEDAVVINTETGWDKNVGSPQQVQDVPGQNRYRTHAQWSSRNILECSKTGIQELYIYMLRDVYDTTSGFANSLYVSSGLTNTKSTNWAPHPSWYWVYTLRYRLGDYRFERELDFGLDSLKAYEYTNRSGDSTCYVVWSATKSGKKITDFVLPLKANDSHPKLVRFSDTLRGGTVQYYRADASPVVIDTVSESPVMVFVANGNTPTHTYTPANPMTAEIYPIDPSWISYKTYDPMTKVYTPYAPSNAGVEVDEQLTVGDPYLDGQEKVQATSENINYTSATLPLFLDVNFPDSVDLAWLYFHDTNAKGYMLIKGDSVNGRRKYIGFNKFQRFNKWTYNAVNQKLKSFRLELRADTKTGEKLNFNEMLVYRWSKPEEAVIDTTGLYSSGGGGGGANETNGPSTVSNGSRINSMANNALLFLPEEYDSLDINRKWPVLISLPGQSSGFPADTVLNRNTPISQLFSASAQNDWFAPQFIVMNPIDLTGQWTADDILTFVNVAKTWDLNIDWSRIAFIADRDGANALSQMTSRNLLADSVVLNNTKGQVILSGNSGKNVATKLNSLDIPVYLQVGSEESVYDDAFDYYEQSKIMIVGETLNHFTATIGGHACEHRIIEKGKKEKVDFCIVYDDHHVWEHFYDEKFPYRNSEVPYWQFLVQTWLDQE